MPTPNVRIRPATSADLFWLRLLIGALMESKPDVYPSMTARDLETQTALLASKLGSEEPSFLCYVAESDATIGGFVLGDVCTRVGEPRHYLFVNFFFVTPAWQGQGIGRALSTAILNAAKASGATHIEFIEQRDDAQWVMRGWPTVGTVHGLDLDSALATVVSTQAENGHATQS